MVRIDSEWPILAVFNFFQYFPPEVVQIDSEWPILTVLQLFQYFPTKVVWIHSEWLIFTVLHLFQYFPTKVVQIDLEWPILAVLQLFQYFPTEVESSNLFLDGTSTRMVLQYICWYWWTMGSHVFINQSNIFMYPSSSCLTTYASKMHLSIP